MKLWHALFIFRNRISTKIPFSFNLIILGLYMFYTYAYLDYRILCLVTLIQAPGWRAPLHPGAYRSTGNHNTVMVPCQHVQPAP